MGKVVSYLSKEIPGSEPMERFAIGPIPPVSFVVDRYVTIKEAAELVEGRKLLPGQELRPHAKDRSIMVLGTWCTDTFMPFVLVNEDQLFDIGENTNDIEEWEKKGYEVHPYDIQYKTVKEG